MLRMGSRKWEYLAATATEMRGGKTSLLHLFAPCLHFVCTCLHLARCPCKGIRCDCLERMALARAMRSTDTRLSPYCSMSSVRNKGNSSNESFKQTLAEAPSGCKV